MWASAVDGTSGRWVVNGLGETYVAASQEDAENDASLMNEDATEWVYEARRLEE